MEEDILVYMECEDEDVVIGTSSSLSTSDSTRFRWENIFGENMLIVHQDRRDWLVGVQVAVLLNRETYNLYRSMKNKGIIMERASIHQIDQLLAQGLVKPGTRSITLIPLDQARSFIVEDQQRVEKRKQTKQTSKKPYEVMRTKLVQPSSHPLSSQWKLSSTEASSSLTTTSEKQQQQQQKIGSVPNSPPTQNHQQQQTDLPGLPPVSLPQQVSFGVVHKEKKGEIRRPIPIHAAQPLSPNGAGPFPLLNGSSSLRSAFHPPAQYNNNNNKFIDTNNTVMNNNHRSMNNNPQAQNQLLYQQTMNNNNHSSSLSSSVSQGSSPWLQIGQILNSRNSVSWTNHTESSSSCSNSYNPQENYKPMINNHSQLPPIGDMLPDLFTTSKDIRSPVITLQHHLIASSNHSMSPLKISSMLCAPIVGEKNTRIDLYGPSSSSSSSSVLQQQNSSFVALPANNNTKNRHNLWMKSIF